MNEENDLSSFSMKEAITHAQSKALEAFAKLDSTRPGFQPPSDAEVGASVYFDSAMVAWVASRFMKFAVAEQYSIVELLQLQAVIGVMLRRIGIEPTPYVRAGSEALAVHALLTIDRTLSWTESEDALRITKPSSVLGSAGMAALRERCVREIIASAMAASPSELALVMTACTVLFPYNEGDDGDAGSDANRGAEKTEEESSPA